MTTNGTPDLTEVIAHIRERARARHTGEPAQITQHPTAAPILSSARPDYDLHELHANLAACNALHNAVGMLNPRRPGLHNQALQFVKKIMRRSLTWYTRPLHDFHSAVTRSLNETTRALEDVRASLSLLEAQVGNLGPRVQSLEQNASASAESLRALQRDVRRVQSDLRESEHRAEKGGGAAPGQQHVSTAIPAPGSELDFDYFMFEERFRGPESEIKRRQQAYVDYFRGCTEVLDLGCGRGEFLELMRENAIPARGVESGEDALLLCREKGLSVTKSDLLNYLESLPDESLGGIFSSQVIEHLPPIAQMRLTRLAHMKLRPGSPLIIETINPECVFALCRNFYLDPTHVRPVHPEMLAFVLRSLGFSDVDIKYSSPVLDRQLPKLRSGVPGLQLEDFNQKVDHVNNFLFGFQDYAASGRK